MPVTDMRQQLQTLRELINKRFDRGDLRDLYFDLEIDYEQADSERKDELARYLIDACWQRGRLSELVAECRQRRPTVDWPNHLDGELDENTILPLLRGYAAEIKATFVTFWSEYVAIGDDNPDSPAERRPLEGIFSYESLEERRTESGPQPGDKAEEKDDKKDDKGKDSSARSIEELSSLRHVYTALRSKSTRGERESITLLIAEPGAGKTLWLRYLATQFAGDIEQPDFPIPIYLPLNAYGGEEDLGSFIDSVLASNEQPPFHRQLAAELGHVMKRRQLLLLMDGLNEISETSVDGMSQKHRLTRTLHTFVKEHRAVCLVASRETDFATSLDWPTIKIHPLDRLGVMRCLNSYCPEAAPTIFRILDEKNLFGTLTSNPYRVRALCQIYKSGRRLPENPGTLYEAFVATLVNREQERRVAQGGQWEPFDRWASAVGELAHALTDSEATAIEPGRLASHLHDPETWSYAEAAGLLHVHTDSLEFSHHQLQEYFAARWLKTGLEADGTEWDGFRTALKKRVWDQPLLLLAGIAAPALLDRLIEPLAAVDPFLACSCVGVEPTRVSAATRQWLAAYMGQALSFAARNGDWALLGKLARAAGEMRCAEGLDVLMQPEAADARLSANSGYYHAVAQANTAEAATFLIAAIEQEASTRQNYWRRAVLAIARALASMRVPEAQRFLACSLLDRRIFLEVLTVIGEVDTGIGFNQLKTLLAHNQFWRPQEEDFYFATLAAAAVRVAPRALLSDLSRHVDKPAAVQMLLRLRAGQRIIDEYVKRHNYTMRRQEWAADARVFGIQYSSFKRDPAALIDLRNCLYHEVGEKAADDFVELLIAATSRAQYNNQEPLAAMQALTIMRNSKVLPALKKLQAMDIPADERMWPYHAVVRNADQLRQLVKSAIEFLEEPRGMGIFKHTLDRFALAMRDNWKKLDSKAIPTSAKDLLDWAHRDQEQFSRFAAMTLERFPDWIRDDRWDWVHDYSELLRSVTRHLSEHGGPELPDMLLRILVTAAEDEREYSTRYIPAVCEQMIEHGRRGPEQKQSIADRVAPLVHRSNQQLQFAAVKVLALIDASEQCPEWLEYLSDRTWPLAYVIVDALGCMTTPIATHDLLVAQLQSNLADERYFAVLALGSIGRKELLSHVLELGSDPSVEVRRAVLWAVSQLGASDPRVAKVLSDGLSSPYARLRREAANTIGTLRIPGLNRELRPLLADSDLRVVERAAWALGQTGDMDSVPHLMNALEGVTLQDKYNYQPGLRQRVEYRLKETIVTSLIQIRVGVNKDVVLEHLDKRDGIFAAFVAGRLDENTWSPLDRNVAEHPGESTESESAARRQDLSTLSRKELETVAWRAADPMERKKAIELLGQSVESYESYYETIPRHDPVPTVQLEALRICARLRQDYERIDTFIGNPKYDLLFTKQLSDAGPEIALHIPLPASWNSDTALWLAQRFPRDYDLEPLIAKLSESLETPYRLDYNQLRALCSLLERKQLTRYCLEGKVSWPIWLEWADLPSGDYSWKPSVEYLLAQRRVWGIVPQLLKHLGQGKGEIPGAVQALCELGIYQAGELIQETVERLRPNVDTEVTVAQVMAQVELSGRFGEKLADRFDDVEFLSGSERHFLYALSNILAESDFAQDIEENLKLEARLSGDSDMSEYVDITWLDRRLQRWGQHHLQGLIQALADANYYNVIEWICENLMPYGSREQYVPKRAEQIARAVRRCPEAMLAAWLNDDSWAVKLVAFCGLAAMRSAELDDHALRLLQDDNPQLPVALLRRADKDRLQVLFRFLQGETDLGLAGSRNEQVDMLLHRAVESHLSGADQDAKRAIITILGDHRTIRFAPTLSAVALNEDRDTAIAALQALRRIGDRGQAATIRPLLDASDLGVLEAAIETIAVLRYRPASGRLLQLLEHPELSIQNAAVGACGLMQIRKAIPQIEGRLLSLKDMVGVELPPTERDISESVEVRRGVTEYELSQAVDATKCALYLLHATPHVPVEGMDFNTGDGLLALVALHWYYTWYYIPTDPAYDRAERFERDFPYPLSLLTIKGSQLITHAIRRDLRAATWTSGRLREVLLASTTFFSEPTESERPERAGDSVMRHTPVLSEPRPATGEEMANAWVATILDAVESIEQRMTDNWDAIRSHWSAAVDGVDLSALTDGFSPDLMWVEIKAVIVATFDRLLKRDQDGNEKLYLPIQTLNEGIRILLELGLFRQDSVFVSLVSIGRSSGEMSAELDDEARLLLAASSESDLQLLVQCHDLAKLYFTCALLASWGYIVLHRLQEQFANPELGTGYFDRVESYFWLAEGIIDGLSIVTDTRTVSDEKVNPLAFMNAQ